MPKNPVKKEQQKHIQAFEAYYAMGENRSLVKLSEEIGVSRVSLVKWSSTFGWQDRILDRDSQVKEGVEKFSVVKTAQAIAENRDMVREMLRDFYDKWKNGEAELPVKSCKDLEVLMNLDLKLSGFLEDDLDDNGQPILNGNGKSKTPSLSLLMRGDESPQLLKDLVTALRGTARPDPETIEAKVVPTLEKELDEYE